MRQLLTLILPLDVASTLSPVILALTIFLLSAKHYPKAKLFSFFTGIFVIGLCVTAIGFSLGQTTPLGNRNNNTSLITDFVIGSLFLIFAGKALLTKERRVKPQEDQGKKIFKWFGLGVILSVTNFDALFLNLTAAKEIGSAQQVSFILKIFLLFINLLFFTLPVTFPIFLYLLFPTPAKRILTKINNFLLKYGKYIVFIIFLTFGLVFLKRGLVLFNYGQSAGSQKYFSVVEKEFSKIADEQNGKVSKAIDFGLWWISPDNLNIINDHSPAVQLELFGCEANPDSKSLFNNTIQTIVPEIDKIMEQNGFAVNTLNSSTSIEDTEFYDYVKAYQRENLRCVFNADPDCGKITDEEGPMYHVFSFGCTDQFDQNYNEQAPYLKELNISNAIIHIQKQTPDFLLLNVNFRRSGISMVAKFIDGKWTEVFAGQDMPSCSLVEEYKIPKDIILDCYQD